MSRFAVLLTSLGLLTGFTQVAYGAGAPAGKALADVTCVACHGQNGIGIVPLYPNLAGQKAEYLVAQMRAFRDGVRKDPIMGPMAAHLTDADIDALAAYYATLRCP